MAPEKQFAVYIVDSKRNGTLYVGMTSNLPQRIWQHKNHVIEGFSDDHNVTILVWFEMHETAESAIAREKQIKKWNRDWKLELIEKENPSWNDLWDAIVK